MQMHDPLAEMPCGRTFDYVEPYTFRKDTPDRFIHVPSPEYLAAVQAAKQ